MNLKGAIALDHSEKMDSVSLTRYLVYEILSSGNIMDDPIFGKLSWGYGQEWESSIDMRPFFGCGRAIYPDDEVGKSVLLQVETGMRKRKPSRLQRNAWRQILDAGDRTWDDALTYIAKSYERQWPIRERYSRELFGDSKSKTLKKVASISELRDLIAPLRVIVRNPAPEQKCSGVSVSLHLNCGWLTKILELIIRDAKIVRANTIDMEIYSTAVTQDATAGCIENTCIGILVRATMDEWWEGVIECDVFSRYLLIDRPPENFPADELARLDDIVSPLSWLIADGLHIVRIQAMPSFPPDERTLEMIAKFVDVVESNARSVMAEVAREFARHENTSKRVDSFRKNEAVDIVPPFADKSLDRIERLVQLNRIDVFTNEHGKVTVGCFFSCGWRSTGLAVGWSSGHVSLID